MMEKMRMETKDLTEDNIKKLGELFPEVLTEAEDPSTKTMKKVIDFDVLKQLLSNNVVEGSSERYNFTWPGKKEAIIEANRPTRKTIRPCLEKSINWDKTNNLYIEGDNLEALKLLQESYLESIKLIYIDPPYNTGKNFIYSDNFTKDEKQYNLDVSIIDDDGYKMVSNTEGKGRFHSDWCSMLYSRLVLARNLLSRDGFIFISIGEQEVVNLRKMCDEIFGERNFVSQISWVSKSGGSGDEKHIISAVEYIIVYAREISEAETGKELIDTDDEKYSREDEYVSIRGKYTLKKLDYRMTSEHYTESLNYPIRMPNGDNVWPGGSDQRQDGGWNYRWSQKKVQWGIENGFIECVNKNGKWTVNSKQYQYVDNNNNLIDRSLAYKNFITSNEFNTTQGSRQIVDYFGNKVFEYAKPVGLIKQIMTMANLKNDDIVLDFFSGSSTTAQAVMEYNIERNQKICYIMVQLPESCELSPEAVKAGFKTICDIGESRIRLAGDEIISKIKQFVLDKESVANIDTGFRVFRIDSPNMKDVYYSPNEYKQSQLDGLIDNIKEDRSSLDLLFGIILEWGLKISYSIDTKIIGFNEVYSVDSGIMIACFDKQISEELIKKIASLKPVYAVFRDSSFSSSQNKINLEEIFKSESPETIVKVI